MNIYDIFLILGALLPLGAGAFFFLFGWVFGRLGRLYRILLLGSAASGLVFQGVLAYGMGRGTRTPAANLFRWSPLPDFEVDLAFRGDFLAFFFALPLAALTFLLVLYLVLRRPDAETGDKIERGRLGGLLLMGEGAALAAFYSADLVMFWGWLEVVGLCFYLLSGPGLRGASSSKLSFQGYCASIMAGFAIFGPLLVIISRNGGVSRYDQLSPATVDSLLFSLIVGGLLVKLAQFPFQVIFGEQKDLPALAHALIGIGALMPLTVYLPARLQIVAADRMDLLAATGWLWLLVSALTIFGAGWLVLRETVLLRRTAFAVTGGFGFVGLALGLGDWPAALWQLLGLSLAGPLLFLCTDLLQIENALPPPDPKNAARAIPIRRPALFRPVLIVCYIIAGAGVLGLPLSAAYAARWQTLSELLNAGYRFYFGLAVVGLGLLALGLGYSFILFLQEPHHSEERVRTLNWWPLLSLVLLALACIGLSFAPNLATDWLALFISRLPTSSPSRLPANLFDSNIMFGLLLLLVLVAGASVSGLARRLQPVSAFNGGLLFGLEAETERKLRLSRSRAIVLQEEEEVFGFEDEFFKTGLRGRATLPPPRLEPRLAATEYFGPLLQGLNQSYKLLDTSYGGSLFGRILLAILNFIRRLFEWLTERFYPALAAFILLIFIFLLTR